MVTATGDLPKLEELQAGPVALDTETTGLDWHRDRVFGVALAWHGLGGAGRSFYGDVRDPGILKWARDVIPQLPFVVNHNIKFDVHMLRGIGVEFAPRAIDCTMVREALLDEGQYDYSLDRISKDRLGEGKVQIWQELADLFGGKPTKEEQIRRLSEAPVELVSRYAMGDADRALRIWHLQEKKIREEDLQVVMALEKRLLEVVIKMERGGVRVDLDRAERAANELDRTVAIAQRELDRVAGEKVNVNSSPQVKKLLGVHKADDGTWRTRDGVLLEPTESGKSGALRTEKLYQCRLPEAQHIAEIRGAIKARDVFLRKYILEMNHNGYVHANINQTRSEAGDGTYTGRFSITEPALQQIHKRNKKMAAIVRACFLPDPGADWVCYDWSQKDFRIFAHYVDDPKINDIYRLDPAADFHKTTAAITGLPRDRDQKTGGANAKQMNLGLIFGMSPGRMAKEMNLPYTTNDKGYLQAGPEAQALFAKYHDNIPGANRLKEAVASVARSRGYIKTQLGRRLRFPGGEGAYKAAGILFQAQAAESMKIKMCELDDTLERMGPEMRLMLVVHDEFDISGGMHRNKKIDVEIKELLERFDGDLTPVKYRIPILADYGTGPDWWEASK